MLKTYLLIACMILLGCAHELEEKWSYSGDQAPYRWGQLDEAYRACGEGRHQSPINLTQEFASKATMPVDLFYEDLSGLAINDGKTIRLEFQKEDSVSVGGKEYYLKQLHFHAKSEHSLDGIFFPAEMHLVHEAYDKSLLVIGFFIRLDESHYDHYGFFKELPKKGETKKTNLVNLRKLSAFNGAHYMYNGSLTTPPCTEDVNWVIFETPLRLSSKQLSSFSAIYSNNYRPVRPMYEHKLYYSK